MSNKPSLKALMAGVAGAATTVSLYLSPANDAHAANWGNNGNVCSGSANCGTGGGAGNGPIEVGQSQTLVGGTQNIGDIRPVANAGIEQSIHVNPTINVAAPNGGYGGGGEQSQTQSQITENNLKGGDASIGNVGGGDASVGNVGADANSSVKTGHIGSNSSAQTGAIDNKSGAAANAGGGQVGNVSPNQTAQFNTRIPTQLAPVYQHMGPAAHRCSEQFNVNLGIVVGWLGGGNIGFGKTDAAGAPINTLIHEYVAMEEDDRKKVTHNLSTKEKRVVNCMADDFIKLKMQMDTHFKEVTSVASIQAEASMYNTQLETNAKIIVETARQKGAILANTLPAICKNPSNKTCIEATEKLTEGLMYTGPNQHPKKPVFPVYSLD